jgi:hypothetical protein
MPFDTAHDVGGGEQNRTWPLATRRKENAVDCQILRAIELLQRLSSNKHDMKQYFPEVDEALQNYVWW